MEETTKNQPSDPAPDPAMENTPSPKRKRATTQVRNPERTRAAILEAARREVAAKGLAGLESMSSPGAPAPTSG